MDDLYGDVLALLPLLRASGHAEEAREILSALTDACNPREILDNLRAALADVGDLPPEAQALRERIEGRIERLWDALPGL